MRDLALGLEFIWSKHLIHRDLKPQNLLLSANDERASLKIADFGFARHLEAAAMAETLCGSPLYMAPEILSFKKYDAKADIWSVGTVLFEMIVGHPPFGGADHKQLLQNIKQSELRIPPDIKTSPACLALLQQLLRRNPSHRSTCAEFLEAEFIGVAPSAPRTSSGGSATSPRGGPAHEVAATDPSQAPPHGASRPVTPGTGVADLDSTARSDQLSAQLSMAQTSDDGSRRFTLTAVEESIELSPAENTTSGAGPDHGRRDAGLGDAAPAGGHHGSQMRIAQPPAPTTRNHTASSQPPMLSSISTPPLPLPPAASTRGPPGIGNDDWQVIETDIDPRTAPGHISPADVSTRAAGHHPPVYSCSLALSVMEVGDACALSAVDAMRASLMREGSVEWQQAEARANETCSEEERQAATHDGAADISSADHIAPASATLLLAEARAIYLRAADLARGAATALLATTEVRRSVGVMCLRATSLTQRVMCSLQDAVSRIEILRWLRKALALILGRAESCNRYVPNHITTPGASQLVCDHALQQHSTAAIHRALEP